MHRIKTPATVLMGGMALFVGEAVYSGNERFYREWVMPFGRFVCRDGELAHRLSVRLTALGLGYRRRPMVEEAALLESKADRLRRQVFGLIFEHPVGMAAGFDKNGEAVLGLLEAGFSHVEVGTVTPFPQPGNPKPRVFRLTDRAGIVNRYGFNSDGHDAVYERLKGRFWAGRGIVGVNLGCNKTSIDPAGDFVAGVRRFGDVADYLVINVSSPNTPGLRDQQTKTALISLLTRVMEARQQLAINKKVPILLKISPDESEQILADIVQVALAPKTRVDGIIVSNTSLASRDEALECKAATPKAMATGDSPVVYGGLSGAPLRSRSTACLVRLHALTRGSGLPLIGVGGVADGRDVADKIAAGACLVQLYTSAVYQGMPVARRVVREYANLV